MSEFGRGYATCLLQFLFHEPRLHGTVKQYAEYRKKEGEPSRLWSEADAVELWANGATDHLYELITGGRLPAEQRRMARFLQADAIDAGHGFRNKYTYEDAKDWIKIARKLLAAVGDPGTIEAAMDVDIRLGLKPELGEAASCSEPLKPW